MTLPTWPGADACYTKAYRILEHMAANGHVKRSYQRGRGWHCDTSQDMDSLIEALNQGDEERIKGLLMMSHVYSTG